MSETLSKCATCGRAFPPRDLNDFQCQACAAWEKRHGMSIVYAAEKRGLFVLELLKKDGDDE